MTVKKISVNKKVCKKRVCAYIRVSTTNGSQLDSLENQKQYFENLYSNREDIEFIGVYYDRGISGSKDKRPRFQAMLEDCRAGKIDVIHTKSIARFARNTVTVLEISRELKAIGIDIFFEEQHIHTLSSEGEVMLSVLASIAEDELRSMSGNQRWAFQKKFQRGELVINTKRFLGYDVDENGSLIVNPEEALIVREIFSLYLEGNGTHRIAKQLNEQGVATVTGAKWHDTTIRHMLSNEKYKGSVLLQKYFHDGVNGPKKLNKGQLEQYLIEDNHEAIISKADWQAVQDKLSSRKWQQGRNKTYRFTGLLKCQHCGSTLKRQVSYKKKIVWCCSKYIKEGKVACQGMRVPEVDISNWTIASPVTVIERNKDGKKYYSYSGQESTDQCSSSGQEENQGSCLLSGIHRPRRTAIKL
ncbi:recombinase family protein [Streptococcus cuniculi]|uniref:Recombinase family protein n=1 Tax=Streptococcus cuniculi TaxID=1432788 RepID=A0A4Y9JBP0_9STRE|nr:recombinase family protein [Streptococcus cuniculi]MBF0778700.1 recombinase family protein [Streptococcus cuniculi]TFU97334.1 recombinase family protein [Streptococcus cuniculi]